MKFTTEDESLDEELQELFIQSSHWTSDLNFAEGEVRFLNKIVQTFFLPGIEKDDAFKMDAFSTRLAEQLTVINILKAGSAALLKTIGPFIGRKNPKIGLGFLEKLTTLENKIRQTAEEMKEIKKGLFGLVEKMLKQHPSNASHVNKSELTAIK